MPVTIAAPRAALSDGSGAKSRSQLSASSASERQKNTAVASGAATAGRSASTGPRSRARIGASSAFARRADCAGSAVSTAIAAMCGSPLAVALTSTLAVPARQRVTGLKRWRPRGREAQCRQQPFGRGQLRGVDHQLRERVAAQVRRGGQHR